MHPASLKPLYVPDSFGLNESDGSQCGMGVNGEVSRDKAFWKSSPLLLPGGQASAQMAEPGLDR